VPPLANHFLRKHAQRYGKPLASFDNAAMQALLEHSWPGNIRELDHVIERAVLLAQGEQVRAVDLALRVGTAGGPKVDDLTLFPGGSGRWHLRRTTFRQNGEPHQLVVLSDLSKALRDEERLAWQRIIRVLGHEINNSLAPIKSIAESLQQLVDAPVRDSDSEEDLHQGLAVISNRAGSLSVFMTSYAVLARLPGPRHAKLDVATWVARTAKLETRVPVVVLESASFAIQGDGDQLDQLLINLVRNAADASLETGGRVAVGWERCGAWLHLWIRDEGFGVANSSNLFVPFFTTKPEGSGIGLALGRQIAKAHGGTLTLENRAERRGAEALPRLPIA
jgi:two-component system nitrogen regulation sensor histidine kinase NtrY